LGGSAGRRLAPAAATPPRIAPQAGGRGCACTRRGRGCFCTYAGQRGDCNLPRVHSCAAAAAACPPPPPLLVFWLGSRHLLPRSSAAAPPTNSFTAWTGPPPARGALEHCTLSTPATGPSEHRRNAALCERTDRLGAWHPRHQPPPPRCPPVCVRGESATMNCTAVLPVFLSPFCSLDGGGEGGGPTTARSAPPCRRRTRPPVGALRAARNQEAGIWNRSRTKSPRGPLLRPRWAPAARPGRSCSTCSYVRW
jgi:hypothetical protein